MLFLPLHWFIFKFLCRHCACESSLVPQWWSSSRSFIIYHNFCLSLSLTLLPVFSPWRSRLLRSLQFKFPPFAANKNKNSSSPRSHSLCLWLWLSLWSLRFASASSSLSSIHDSTASALDFRFVIWFAIVFSLRVFVIIMHYFFAAGIHWHSIW